MEGGIRNEENIDEEHGEKRPSATGERTWTA